MLLTIMLKLYLEILEVSVSKRHIFFLRLVQEGVKSLPILNACYLKNTNKLSESEIQHAEGLGKQTFPSLTKKNDVKKNPFTRQCCTKNLSDVECIFGHSTVTI